MNKNTSEILLELLKVLKDMLQEFEYDNATEYECNLFYQAKQVIKKAEKI